MRKRTTLSNILYMLPLLPLIAALILAGVVIGKFAASPQELPPIFESPMIERLEGAAGEGVDLVQLTTSPSIRKGSLAWNPNGGEIAYAIWYPPEIYLLNVSGKSEHQLTDWNGWGSSGLILIGYSKDGLELYFRTGYDFWVMPSSGGQQRQIAQSEMDIPEEDDTFFVIDGELWEEAADGSSEEIIPTKGGFVIDIEVSPDRNRVVYCTQSETFAGWVTGIWLIDFASDVEKCLIDTSGTNISIRSSGTSYLELSPDSNSIVVILEEHGIAQVWHEIFQLKF